MPSKGSRSIGPRCRAADHSFLLVYNSFAMFIAERLSHRRGIRLEQVALVIFLLGKIFALQFCSLKVLPLCELVKHPLRYLAKCVTGVTQFTTKTAKIYFVKMDYCPVASGRNFSASTREIVPSPIARKKAELTEDVRITRPGDDEIYLRNLPAVAHTGP